MKLYHNTMFGLRHKGWTHLEAVAYFIKGVARELHIAPTFFFSFYEAVVSCRKEKAKEASREKEMEVFRQKWLKQSDGESYFDFGVCKLPDVSGSKEKMQCLNYVFDDTLMFPCFLNDNYDRYMVEYFDRTMHEGPYGYTDGAFDVTVKKGDVVIDAGAWIGDFSAYAASKGATAYAFEPVSETYQLLCKTQMLNNVNGGGANSPRPKRLGSCRV
ncbi:MAG: hypothetical protein LBB73_01800 [Dysgonamonadaceae bacterium]|jgi:hypothetical protein|nr:hypothetical protein [Dysgonamonadaceae bacterium]